MTFFGILFTLIFLASIIFLIIGLISPTSALFWYKGNRTRGRSSAIYGGAAAIAFIATGIFAVADSKSSSPIQTAAATAEPSPTERAATPIIPNLVPSVDELKERYNTFAYNNSLDEISDEIEIKRGEVNNVATVRINENSAWNLTLNKIDNSVKEVTAIGMGDGTMTSGGNIILSMTGLIATVQPTLAPNERGDILKRLNILGGTKKDISNLDEKCDYKGVHYWVTSSEELGIWFGATMPNSNTPNNAASK